MSTLTTYQKQLMSELTEIYELVQFDYYDIEEYPEEWRSNLLELMRREVIRSRVVTVYTRVDEYLCCELCLHFFGSGDFPELWKTEKFQLFNYQFLEEVSLMPKLRYVKALQKIPKNVLRDIEKLNALRNGVAHAFFPENLKKSPARWDGKDLFTLEGLKAFQADMSRVLDYFATLRKGRW
ncbi:MAG TPA: hypothetical protein VNH19_24205 [Candidatus Limnocylindrales bacterium]|nr:hypothetical protein [Candidatus Limnocylindrales bacterium]